MHKILILLAASATLFGANAYAVDRGELLASTCMSCHGAGGKSKGAIPTIAGLDKAYIVKSLQDFKSGARSASVMQRHSKGYTDEEFALMADYLSKLK
ncbi:MAG: c-type cytochrome [Pseudomonadota bacterium]